MRKGLVKVGDHVVITQVERSNTGLFFVGEEGTVTNIDYTGKPHVLIDFGNKQWWAYDKEIEFSGVSKSKLFEVLR